MTTVVGIILLAMSGLSILILGYIIGRFRGRTVENDAGGSSKPVCPCGHVWGSHRDGQRCQDEVRRLHYWRDGTCNGYEWVRCACTKYHGPILITDEFFHPGVTS